MRITRGTTALALLACGVMLAASGVLAGCGSGSGSGSGSGGSHSPGAGTSTRQPDSQTMAEVRCYRSHGDPSFPDPIYDPHDGRWHFAVSPGTAPASTQLACQHLFPAAAASPPVPQAQFQALVRLAECLRRHGVPNWPDPNAEGQYLLPPPLLQKTQAYVRASAACDRYWPRGGIDVVAAPHS